MEENINNSFPQEKEKPMNDLTDRDFYNQACAYFYYHAGQRMNMINYFIAVFGASLALYGSLLSVYTIASLMIAAFLIIISLLFYYIDLRNRFDVKESQIVIEHFEKKYGYDTSDGSHAYGVFSNERNVFWCFGRSARRDMMIKRGKEYRELVLAKKKHDPELSEKVKKFLQNDNSVSEEVLIDSLDKPTLFTLSGCIRTLYLLCTIISVGGVLLASLISAGIIVLG